MMSRADWSFLEHLLEEGQEYSTGIGRIWLTILFLFRMLTLGVAAESAWDDEQAKFVCNTNQPGCTAVCYDRAFPISHFRYFVLQVIFVSTPTIFYFGYVALRVANKQRKEEEKQAGEGNRGGIVIERENNNEDAGEKEKKEEGRGGRKSQKTPFEVPKLKGRLLCAYAFSIFLKVLLEIGFMVGLWILYNGFFIAAKFECKRFPCPHTVDCFVSRPTEKTIFTIYTQAIAAISLLLNLVELLQLLQLAITQRLEKRYRAQQHCYFPMSERVITREVTLEPPSEAPQTYRAGSHVDLPSHDPCESYRDQGIEGDLLPSYLNCMGAMRKTQSPRVHYKKTAQHTPKNTKGAHKGRSNQKHYV
ncbi:gap junction protein alpha 4 [Labrus mixtus]|uniref:gap junction protein alpha 4 n=1 Tax=Labrus mixtus TaxID=508554 RepID=UPI0029BFF9D5|nr:gap junction protein alpha 4 [Labrus mixtus]